MAKLHTVAWTMGTSKRITKELESQTSDVPEPGKYGMPKQVGNKDVPKWSLNKDVKLRTLIDNQPGPNDYTIRSLIDEGPKYGMGSKTVYNHNPLLTNTGPGDYDPEKVKTTLSYTLTGRSKNPANLGHPGPGSYDNTNNPKFVPGAGLGKNQRLKGKIQTNIIQIA
jgi:hypothetical protein